MCRLCGSNVLIEKFRTNGCIVEKCGNCKFVQVKERPDKDDHLDMYSAGYFADSKYKDKFVLLKEYKRRLNFLKNQGLKRGAKVLEIGCATGDFIHYASADFDMCGLDISEYAANEAKRRNPEIADRIHAGMIEEQHYDDDFFDAIVLWDAIEHIWDPVKACKKLSRILKPGGRIFISTPNAGSLIARLMGRYWAFMTVPEHLCFFSRSTITYMFEKKLNLSVTCWMTKGKWVNCGFLLYKVKRIFPKLVPSALISLFQKKYLNKASLYVPSGDIQYLAARKDIL